MQERTKQTEATPSDPFGDVVFEPPLELKLCDRAFTTLKAEFGDALIVEDGVAFSPDRKRQVRFAWSIPSRSAAELLEWSRAFADVWSKFQHETDVELNTMADFEEAWSRLITQHPHSFIDLLFLYGGEHLKREEILKHSSPEVIRHAIRGLLESVHPLSRFIPDLAATFANESS